MTDPLPPDLSVQRIEELQAQCRNAFDLPQIRLSELSALLSLAHSAASGSEWRPIESAPKDREIMVCGPYDEPCCVRWHERTSQWRGTWQGHDAIMAQGDTYTDYHETGPVTHWQPLPPPPTKKEPETNA